MWSLLRWSIVGPFHKISVKHLIGYIEELEWHFDNRDTPYMFHGSIKRIMRAPPPKYREPVDALEDA